MLFMLSLLNLLHSALFFIKHIYFASRDEMSTDRLAIRRCTVRERFTLKSQYLRVKFLVARRWKSVVKSNWMRCH